MLRLARARRPVIVVAVLVGAALLAVAGPSDARARAASPHAVPRAVPSAVPRAVPRVDRVLVLALPATSWADVRDARVPNLDRLLAGSAVADLTTRSHRTRTSPGDGYLTLGSGARVVASSSLAGQNLAAGERYGDDSVAEVFARRTGLSLRSGVGALGIPRYVDDNDSLPYDAVPGALGQALHDAGVTRTVIGNADQAEPEPVLDRLHREAALALVDETGRTPGTVDGSLVRRDPSAPFGVRMDVDTAVRAFERAWNRPGRHVVVLEVSDLARADAYRSFSSPEQRKAMKTAALHVADELVRRLMPSVSARDAVLTVAPYHTSHQRELTVIGLHAPGVTAGWLDSSTTRRTGFVGLTDVAPTVLERLGIDRPDSMEGRPFTVAASGTSYEDKVQEMVDQSRAAVFRDNTIGGATTLLSALLIILLLVWLVGVWRPLPGMPLVVRLLALGTLGFLAATYLAAPLPFFRWGSTPYWVFVLGLAAAIAAVATVIARRDAVLPVLLVLGGLVVMQLVDALTGAHLELDAVFGYTPTVGIRVAGLGNPGSAILSAAALIFVVVLVARFPARAVRTAAFTLLAVTAVVIAAPFFGQDFGGALSVTPAYVLVAVLLSRRRVTLRGVLILAGVLVVSGLLAGFVDLARPADQRTHVGRFFEKVGSDGLSGFTTVVGRKAGLMIDSFRSGPWLLLLVILVVGLVGVARRTTRFGRLERRVPTIRAGLWAFVVMAVLGLVLNDSGVQVPAYMMAVLVPTLLWLDARADADETLGAATPGTAREPDARRPGEPEHAGPSARP